MDDQSDALFEVATSAITMIVQGFIAMRKRTLLNMILTWILLAPICAFGQDPRVQEIPLPKEAAEVSYSKSRGDIRLKVATDMKASGEAYQSMLSQQQWTKSGKDNLQKNFWEQTFVKQNRTLLVRVDKAELGCDIRITPKGFLWDEDFAPRPESLPIPEEAERLKYDDFFQRIHYYHKNTQEQLIDFYNSQLDSKTWTKSGTDLIREKSAYLKRTSGKASIEIILESEKGLQKVEISTRGMSWDEIKQKNASAKKELASNKPNSSEKNSIPKRIEKPKQGIASMEKLTSRCSLTVDGKTFDLPEVVAYEVIYYGKWRTHVVATQTPVKQDSLLKLLQANVPEESWGQNWKLPSPHVKLVLDDKDVPENMQLLANNVPGIGSTKELVGSALVEEGRARGKYTLPSGKFFKHDYSAEITFDTPLLTQTSTPKKLLANAPKLDNTGKITLAGKTHTLAHVTAYSTKSSEKTVTQILLTEKAIDAAKLQAALKKTGEVDERFSDFQTQIKLTINESDELVSVFIWCDGLSLNWSGNDKIKSLIQSEGGRVRGTAQTIATQDALGKKCDFQASFDTMIIGPTGADATRK